MNAEITLTQKRVRDLFYAQRVALAGQTRQFLTDLQHEADDLRNTSGTYSERVAAEINHAATTSLLEARR